MPPHHLTQDLLLSTLRQAALQVTHHHPASLGPQCGIPSSSVGGGGVWEGEGLQRWRPGSQPQMSQQWACGLSASCCEKCDCGARWRFRFKSRCCSSPSSFSSFFSSSPFTSVCLPANSLPDAVAGIIWLMTAEFPYLITNRIWAPLELLGEESDEWQGRAQWPERGERAKTAKSVKQGCKKKERERLGDGKRTTMSYLFLPLPLCRFCRVFSFFFTRAFGFQSWKQKPSLLLKLAGVC